MPRPSARLLLAAALLPACAASGPAQQQAPSRPPFVRVQSRYAAAPARAEGCRVEFSAQAPGPDKRLRKLADLELTGSGLDRARAQKLLAAKACAIGAETLVVTDEDYGSPEAHGSVEATAYAFHSPVQILPSGLELEADARPLDCRVLYFRTQRPEREYDELAGLSLSVKPQRYAIDLNPEQSQARLLDELRQAACHLGADAIVLTEEHYDVPSLGSRLAGTAILFRESRQRRPAPGSTEL